MKFSFLAVILLFISISAFGQVNDKTVAKYLTGRDWVIISEKSDGETTHISYDDLMYLRFNEDNTASINLLNESPEEELYISWEYNDGFLLLKDESGDMFGQESNSRIEFLDSTRLTLKVIEEGITYLYCQERKNFKAQDLGLYEKAVELNTQESYQNYIDKMPGGKYVSSVKKSLSAYIWDEVRRSRDVQKIEDFCETYPQSEHYADAQYLRDELLWAECMKAPGKAAYVTYINNANPTYADHIDEALSKYEEFLWADAVNANSIEMYNEYLRVYPEGRYKAEAWDHRAFAEAKKENSIPSFNKYLSMYPSGRHVAEAREILVNAYLYWGNKSFDAFISAKGSAPITNSNSTLSSHIDEALLYYDRMISEYPGDAKTIEMKNSRYGEACFYKAELLYAEGKYSECVRYYDKSIAASSNGWFVSEANSKKTRAEKTVKRNNLPDLQFIEYNGSTTAPIGFMWGSSNVGRIGGWLSAKISPGIFVGTSYYTYDGHQFIGNVMTPQKTGKEVRSTGSVTTGLTIPLGYPFALYGGAGYYYEAMILQVDETDDYGDYYDTKWIRDESRTFSGVEASFGLTMNTYDISFSAGISLVNFEKTVFNFGIGWTF